MQYITNHVSKGQMLRYYNALDEAYTHCGVGRFDPDSVKVSVNGLDSCECLDFNGEFRETYYQDVLGFSLVLFHVEHRGLWKVFTDETGTEIFSLVLMPAQIDEN